MVFELRPTKPRGDGLEATGACRERRVSAESLSHRSSSIDLGARDRSIYEPQNATPTNLPNDDTSLSADDGVPFLASGTEHGEDLAPTIATN